jgi:hypothetical protein
MSSRIPQLRHRPTKKEPHHPSDDTSHKLSNLHANLTTLGAPQDLHRICKGPLGDALFFLGEHVRGRTDVAIARAHIRGIGEFTLDHLTFRISNHLTRVRGTRSNADKASSRFAAANKSMQTYEAQLEGQENLLSDARMFITYVGHSSYTLRYLKEEESNRLQACLARKRHVVLLLSVLEKEAIRTKRFQEITTLLNDLRHVPTFPLILHLTMIYSTLRKTPSTEILQV